MTAALTDLFTRRKDRRRIVDGLESGRTTVIPEAPPSIAQRIHLVTQEIPPVHKRKAEHEEGFDFISAVDVLAAVREPMLRHGLVITPSMVGLENKDLIDRETGTTIPNRLTQVELDFKLEDPLAQVPPFHRRWYSEAADGHAIKKAMTEGVKTFYLVLFQIRVLPPGGTRPPATRSGKATTTRSEQRRQQRRAAELERPISAAVVKQIIRPLQGARTDDQVDELVRDQFGVDGLAVLPRKHTEALKHLLTASSLKDEG